MAVDWAAARLDYVTHHELTYADIAAKYKAHPATIWRRAAQERWTKERKTSARNLLEKAREKVVVSQSEALAACNARHLEIAQKFDSAVKQLLERGAELSESQLRHLMSVAEGAQRIARLALGAGVDRKRALRSLRTNDRSGAGRGTRVLERLGVEPAVQ